MCGNGKKKSVPGVGGAVSLGGPVGVRLLRDGTTIVITESSSRTVMIMRATVTTVTAGAFIILLSYVQRLIDNKKYLKARALFEKDVDAAQPLVEIATGWFEKARLSLYDSLDLVEALKTKV